MGLQGVLRPTTQAPLALGLGRQEGRDQVLGHDWALLEAPGLVLQGRQATKTISQALRPLGALPTKDSVLMDHPQEAGVGVSTVVEGEVVALHPQ